ncbi:MAG: hypothetical protein HFE97_05170 [Oscillospiraceae bacterium]|nr:hypothetical protein [Oscillospiraceae bacterium]
MKKRMLTVLLAVLLGTALILPAEAASGSPQALLKTITYYGDPAQCQMTAAQAKAFSQVIQRKIASMNEERTRLDWVGDGTMRYYAALFDTGNGIPALFFGGGLVINDLDEWDDSGCFWGGFGTFGIWQYRNGQAVELEEEIDNYGNMLAIYDSYVFAGGPLGSDGSAYNGRVYPFKNGKISTQPSTTAQWRHISDDFAAPRVFQIDGSPATEAQFDAWKAKWDTTGLAGHEVGGGVEGLIWGCCPAEYMTITLNNYANAVQPTAYASTQLVEVDGIPMQFQAYALKDANGNDTNYVKLRDVAEVLNGTEAQFQVGWDGAVNLTTNMAYTPDGSEFSTPFSGNRPYEKAAAPTKVNGQIVSCAAILLKDDAGNGYTYYKLRDLGQLLGFNVGWSAERGIYIETDRPYSGT